MIAHRAVTATRYPACSVCESYKITKKTMLILGTYKNMSDYTNGELNVSDRSPISSRSFPVAVD